MIVTSEGGKTLAVTALRAGHMSGEGCEFMFWARVPAGLLYYDVIVSHRDTVKESESNLSNIQFTLG